MNIIVNNNVQSLAKEAAEYAATVLNQTIEEKGIAHFIAATGASQFEFLEELVNHQKVDWSKTVMFHLDEYVGISINHPASFRRYLTDRLIKPAGINQYNLITGDSPELQNELSRLNQLISDVEIDIAFVGIGENGHLAFNDPPADFDTTDPYLVVDLDLKCRLQQVNEGWFSSIEEVPERAVTMSVNQIMKSRKIVCVVPGARKETAVTQCLADKSISDPMKPASVLNRHNDVNVYLDTDSARGLSVGENL